MSYKDRRKMTPNEQIKSSRKEAGLTQKQLCECCGLDQPSLSKIENGTGNPTLETLEKISKCLGQAIVIPNTVCIFETWNRQK